MRYTRRLTDAASVGELARMLEAEDLRRRLPVEVEEALFVRDAVATVGVQPGTLVRALNHDTVEPAGSESGTAKAATHIVLELRGNRKVLIASEAVVYVKVIGDAPVGAQPLYLGRLGHPTFTRPSGSGELNQSVGFAYHYDQASKKHLCHIRPAADLGAILP